MLVNQTADHSWSSDCFEAVEDCPWCSSRDLMIEIEGVEDWFFNAVPGQFDFARCSDCGSLVLTRRPKKDVLGFAYSNYYTHLTERTKSRQGAIRRLRKSVASSYINHRYSDQSDFFGRLAAFAYNWFPERRLELDVNHRFLPSRKGKVLDYGSGNGSFLKRAKDLGHDVIGIEFDPEAIDVSAVLGLTVLSPEEATASIGERSIDFVSFAHVLEHVPEPLVTLREARRWMKEGAGLFIELPNPNAEGLVRFSRFWRGLEAPRHFSLPSRKGLADSLSEIGFRSIEFHERQSVSSWLWAESRSAMANKGTVEIGPQEASFSSCEAEFITLSAVAR